MLGRISASMLISVSSTVRLLAADVPSTERRPVFFYASMTSANNSSHRGKRPILNSNRQPEKFMIFLNSFNNLATLHKLSLGHSWSLSSTLDNAHPAGKVLSRLQRDAIGQPTLNQRGRRLFAKCFYSN
jgi:hypothetical protein